jgi:hypothetical protein
MVEKTDKCARAGCGCPASSAGGYCSEECEQAEGELEGECRCGHAQCD